MTVAENRGQLETEKKNLLSQSEMHATELRNEVKPSGFQTAYLATNKGVCIVLRLVPFSRKKSGNDTDSDVALNCFTCRAAMRLTVFDYTW